MKKLVRKLWTHKMIWREPCDTIAPIPPHARSRVPDGPLRRLEICEPLHRFPKFAALGIRRIKSCRVAAEWAGLSATVPLRKQS